MGNWLQHLLSRLFGAEPPSALPPCERRDAYLEREKELGFRDRALAKRREKHWAAPQLVKEPKPASGSSLQSTSSTIPGIEISTDNASCSEGSGDCSN